MTLCRHERLPIPNPHTLLGSEVGEERPSLSNHHTMCLSRDQTPNQGRLAGSRSYPLSFRAGCVEILSWKEAYQTDIYIVTALNMVLLSGENMLFL